MGPLAFIACLGAILCAVFLWSSYRAVVVSAVASGSFAIAALVFVAMQYSSEPYWWPVASLFALFWGAGLCVPVVMLGAKTRRDRAAAHYSGVQKPDSERS